MYKKHLTHRKNVAALRKLAARIEDNNEDVLFVENDCPFVAGACDCIESGGMLDAASLASLIHYIADMME